MSKFGCVILLLVFGFAIVASGNVHTNEIDQLEDETEEIRPNAPYLMGWAKKFTELNEIPQCTKVPALSDEERFISKKCPRTNKNLLCSNIFLFSVVRDMCRPFVENVKILKQGVRDIIDEIGLRSFATMPMGKIFVRLEKKTGIKIGGFMKQDATDLVMDVLGELAKEAGYGN